jgi:hypothetical protein
MCRGRSIATNPLAPGFARFGADDGLLDVRRRNNRGHAPDAKLFKAFNQTGFENMADASSYAARPVRFVAVDNAAVRPMVMGFATGRI